MNEGKIEERDFTFTVFTLFNGFIVTRTRAETKKDSITSAVLVLRRPTLNGY